MSSPGDRFPPPSCGGSRLTERAVIPRCARSRAVGDVAHPSDAVTYAGVPHLTTSSPHIQTYREAAHPPAPSRTADHQRRRQRSFTAALPSPPPRPPRQPAPAAAPSTTCPLLSPSTRRYCRSSTSAQRPGGHPPPSRHPRPEPGSASRRHLHLTPRADVHEARALPAR
ncbi:hypothetical protein Krad_4526 (plasmid) [Kineococcus radiotolerans SRS30216 = ATCC BAA-149]|uniref:Uncharacterized protein n=1 Tax=Kineococcus radiotolerans (strain ATCC BAA-149 / DSM 14245 / SRS30216) TaxID=266940 RepID=A6WGP6_KINRD|nr:hypothetical protein Krad_4526 [Kineococcus radiotolerans SRS30216 = ATCC BAA-149]